MQYSVQMTESELKEYLKYKDDDQQAREREFSARVRLDKLVRLMEFCRFIPGDFTDNPEFIEAFAFAQKLKAEGYG